MEGKGGDLLGREKKGMGRDGFSRHQEEKGKGLNSPFAYLNRSSEEKRRELNPKGKQNRSG